MIPPEAVNAVQGTVTLLADGDYTALQNLTQGRRFSADEIAAAVREYGHKLVWPPAKALHDPDVPATERVVDGIRHIEVEFRLWTEDEGQSKFTITLILTEVLERVFGVEIAALGPA
ncbi:hypothetical protein [Amycolatopsis sp. NPDC052450]|uniref:DUF7668 domain-containing protein n=1 Tax=Amycolatopsis sp. NPDC052450 TaxID=3363937 RepID=UPI0037C74405